MAEGIQALTNTWMGLMMSLIDFDLPVVEPAPAPEVVVDSKQDVPIPRAKATRFRQKANNCDNLVSSFVSTLLF
jgi:hypothetical protein